ncbi:unnamed protein product [Periconia digitata]|uniref:Peptidase A1 domain-containing protein n=1 Tax=Periconia digitata TaxID=1303443 RepID=A0A9W4U7D4_9PLEO|nr:unnamed protein product [Periconia digitata]
MNQSAYPPPIVVSPSGNWDGNDGSWSTFIVRVGSPEQLFRVLPSTADSKTLVPMPEGCTESDPEDCGESRGVFVVDGHPSNGFQHNRSTTWNQVGLYKLGLEENLNYTGAALYGLDNLGLNVPQSGGVTLPRQIVGGVATKDYYLGHFGLGDRPTNFSDSEHPQPSYLRTLRDEEKIPSMSYGYTAGASYRTPQITGSLVLGGYDETRRKNIETSFPFDPSGSHMISLTVQSIDTTNSLLGPMTVHDTPFYVNIDSTIPHLWLPVQACEKFEQVFGLQYDPTTQLYLVNSTSHDRLKQMNPSINFQLGASRDPNRVVNINFPYGAFDLQASHPFYPNATNYFPIRRANETQFTLGRTFLQEAYLITDYENQNFSISQAAFETPLQERIVPIVSKDYANRSTNASKTYIGSSALSNPAIVGISIGSFAFILVVVAAFYFFFKIKKDTAESKSMQPKVEQSSSESGSNRVEVPDNGQCEMDAVPTLRELNGSEVYMHEVDAWHAAEVAGSTPLPSGAHEMST